MEPFIKQIEDMWVSRAKAQYLTYQEFPENASESLFETIAEDNAAYLKTQAEFFVGAMTAIQAIFPDDGSDRLSSKIPPHWTINIMSSRPVVEETQ